MKTSRTILAALFLTALITTAAVLSAGPPIQNFLWADGTLYRTILTDTDLPNYGPKDGLFVIPDLAGQRPVAESKPGDLDYNGGRWQVYVIDVVDASAIDHELTSWEEVQSYMSSGDLAFGGMGPAFVCPVIK